MTTIRPRQITLEQFLALPDEKPALEYFHGEVTQKVSPLARHGRLQFKFAEIINTYAEPRRLAMALPEIRGTFAGASRVPDIGIFAWDRIPRTPDSEIGNNQFIPPDIAIEILSPGQSRRDLTEKCRWYVANGVRIALLVDDERLTVTRFAATGGEETLRGNARIDLDAVLPGFELTAQALFDTLRID